MPLHVKEIEIVEQDAAHMVIVVHQIYVLMGSNHKEIHVKLTVNAKVAPAFNKEIYYYRK